MAASKLLLQLKASVGKHITPEVLPFYAGWLHGKLLAFDKGTSEMEYEVRQDMCNPGKILHGGVAAGILDDQIGMTVAAMGLENLYLSINLAVDFIGIAKLGEKVICSVQIEKAGKKVLVASAKITDQTGNMVARATTNMINSGKPTLSA